MSLPWFRLYAEFAGDPIVQSLAFEDQRHFIIILCLKCDGLLDRKVPETRRELIIARALGLDPLAAEEAKRRLIEVDLCDGKWQPIAWKRRQFSSDNSTERTRKYRKNKDTGNVSVTLRNGHSDAPDTDTDKKKINKEKRPKKTNIPDGFKVSDRVKKWAQEKSHYNLESHLDNFKLQCRSKNYQYVDWDAAFMSAIRNDWAKLSRPSGYNSPAQMPSPPRRPLAND